MQAGGKGACQGPGNRDGGCQGEWPGAVEPVMDLRDPTMLDPSPAAIGTCESVVRELEDFELRAHRERERIECLVGRR